MFVYVRKNIDEEKVIEVYNGTKSINKTALYFDLSTKPIRRILSLHKIKIGVRKNEFNEQFFNNIDTPEKAYYLGYIFADGSIRERDRGGSEFQFKLHKKDKFILDRLNILMESSSVIKRDKKNAYILSLYSNQLVKNLISIGCTQNKSLTLEFPDTLSKEFYSNFILGYFDGDGSAGVYGNNRMFTLAGTFKFLSRISEILLENKIKNSLFAKGNICILQSSNKESLFNLNDYFYKNYDGIRLHRKEEKFKMILDSYK